MRRTAIIWIRELTMREILTLPVHITEAWTALINKNVLCFTLYTHYIPTQLDERIDNISAMNRVTNMKSRDPSMTDIYIC